VFLVLAAAWAASVNAVRRAVEPCRGRPNRFLPAEALLPGQIPAQLARWPAVRNTLIICAALGQQHDRSPFEVKSGVLPDEAVHWLKANFFKTELELGHCLRLPAEGPCECDLYLTCAKFVTTGEYAPRLRARLDVEQQLIQDAYQRGWAREARTAHRHRQPHPGPAHKPGRDHHSRCARSRQHRREHPSHQPVHEKRRST
jgi:hypothetical protein